MTYDDVTGNLFNIQRFSLHDGPGLRTVLFFKGCGLRCKWCSNPESQSSLKELYISALQCIGCGTCVRACPHGTVHLSNGGVSIDRATCMSCGVCVHECPSGAIQFYGREYTAKEVLEFVLKDAAFYQSSGGGVTLSGGDALMQPDFAFAVLSLCKEYGINTAIETCGFAPWEYLERLSGILDVIYFDVKHVVSKSHLKGTGVGCEEILANLKKLVVTHNNVVVRIPVIPGFNDDEQSKNSIITWIAQNLPQRVHVELMAYHNYGARKYEFLNREYLMKNAAPPQTSAMELFRTAFADKGIDCNIIN